MHILTRHGTRSDRRPQETHRDAYAAEWVHVGLYHQHVQHGPHGGATMPKPKRHMGK